MYFVIIVELAFAVGQMTYISIDQNVYSMNERYQYETIQIAFIIGQKIFYNFMLAIQIFEWFLYTRFIIFQSTTADYELVSRQKEYNRRERCYLVLFMIFLGVLIGLQSISEYFMNQFSILKKSIDRYGQPDDPEKLDWMQYKA